MKSNLTALSRKLRSNPTEAEKLLWGKLKSKQADGLKFRRQAPIGPYIVDFFCRAHSLIIEVDGGQHCENANDLKRDSFLRENGFMVLRFWNNEVMENMEGVLQTIINTVNFPPPEGEGQGGGLSCPN